MNAGAGRASRRVVVLAVVSLTLVAFAIRARLVPGIWNVDALHYGDLLLGGARPDGGSNRDFRWMFLGLLRIGRAVAGNLPVGASLPSLVFGTAAVPLTWLAVRRPLGAATALLPAAIVALTPVAIEESMRPSADGPLAAFGAALLWLLVALEDAQARRRRWTLLGVGALVGTAVVFKETFALVAAPAAFWLAFQAARRRVPWPELALAATPALLFVALDQWASTRLAHGGRFGLIDARMAELRRVGPDSARRLALGPLPSCATDVVKWGGLFLTTSAAATLAATGRTFRSPATWLAFGGLLALWFLPISMRVYAVLPGDQPRYLLGSLPALATLPFLAFVGPPPSNARRAVAALVGIAALCFARHDVWLAGPTLIAVAAAAWPNRFGDAAPWVFGAAVVASLVPHGGPWIEVGRWTFVASAACAFAAPRRPERAVGAAATALVAAALVAYAARAPMRDEIVATWSLEDQVVDAKRVFATRRWAPVLWVSGAGARAQDLQEWSNDDVVAGRLPPGAVAGDACVCAVGEGPTPTADPRFRIVVEPHGPALVLRLSR